MTSPSGSSDETRGEPGPPVPTPGRGDTTTPKDGSATSSANSPGDSGGEAEGLRRTLDRIGQEILAKPPRDHADEAPPEIPLPSFVPPDFDIAKVPPEFFDLLNASSRGGFWPFYAWGPTGTGKTCAAAGAFVKWKRMNERRAADQMPLSILFENFGRLCDALTAIRRSPNGLAEVRLGASGPVALTEGGFWTAVEKRHVVILDEIGHRTDSEFRNEVMARILDLRNGKPLLLTGNINPMDLSKLFDDRISSRIFKGVLCELEGADQRIAGVLSRAFKIGVRGGQDMN